MEFSAQIPIVGLVNGLLQLALPSPTPEPKAEDTEPPKPELEVWDIIGFTDLSVRFDGTTLAVEGVLDVLPGYEPTFPIPGFDKLALVINRLGVIRVELEIDQARLAIIGPSVALRLDPAWLKPVTGGANSFAEIELVELGYLNVDTDGNVEFGAFPGGRVRFVTNNDPWRIGESSVTLETGELDVILKKGPEGGPAVTLTDATLRFSQDLAAKDGTGFEIALTDARIDSQGFSGTVSARFPGTEVDDAQNPTKFVGDGAASLFGFEFGVNTIDLEFRNNLPVRSAIRGGMILPFFDEAVGCTLSIASSGDFRVTFTDVDGDGLIQFTKPNFCRLALTAFDLNRTQGLTTLTLGGEMELLASPGEVGSLPKLTIQDLSINSRGEVALKSGWVDLNPALSLDLVGFILTIERLGIGFDPTMLWFGVTGGITLVNGLPRATVDELRIIFALPGGSPSLALKGATLDADIGGQIQLYGSFSMLSEPGVSGFAGDVRLSVSSGFGLDGSLLVGINTAEGYPFLYVYIGVELPAGIPLGPTGISIFGFAGLFGYNVAPSRKPDQHWYYDWYRGPPGPGVTQSAKWTPRRDAFALGAGITLGTADGYTVVVRALFVITLPSFALLIEGRAGFLTERSSLSQNPPLRILVIIDTESILFAIEAQYEFVENVLFAHGLVEGYFPFKSGAWHIYLGEKPDSRRIVADVLKQLFRADAYVMIDGTKTEFGGKIGYALDKKFGPCGVAVRAALTGEGTLSYEPIQLTASLSLVGSLKLSAFGATLGADLQADITVRVPTPFLLSMHFQAKLDLPWPLPDPEIEFDVRWEEIVAPPYPAPLLGDAAALASISSDTFALRPGAMTEGIPLDGRLAINFDHALSKPGAGRFPRLLNFPATFFHQISPQHSFRYDLSTLRLERLAADGSVAETFDLDTSTTPLFGHWQITPPGLGGITSGPPPAESSRAPGGTLLLLAKTPFEYLQSVTTKDDGTSVPAPLPSYESLPVTPPTGQDIDICDVLAPAGDGGVNGADGWSPSDGETASGDPDPAAPTRTVTPGGGVVVVRGFPEPSPSPNGGPPVFTDPTGGPFGIEIDFPTPVVITDVTVDPGPGGDISVTLDGEPAHEPPPVTAPDPGTTPQPPQKPSGGHDHQVLCCVAILLLTLVVLLLVLGFGLGWFEPWLPRTVLAGVFVLLLGTVALGVLWWWGCRCGCRELLARCWHHVSGGSQTSPMAQSIVSPSPRIRGGAQALDLLRRIGRSGVRLAPAVATDVGSQVTASGSTAMGYSSNGSVGSASSGLTAASTGGATTRSAAMASTAAATAASPSTGKVADQVSITGSTVSCGKIEFVDAAEWGNYARAEETNTLRTEMEGAYASQTFEILKEEAFLLRANSRYRVRFTVTKSGRESGASTESHEGDATDLEFRTQPWAPADLRPYVLFTAPDSDVMPIFRADEIGVRFMETYVRQMYVRAADAQLAFELHDTAGKKVAGRSLTTWRKAEDHVDRTGKLAYLTRVNTIYGSALAASALPRDDILVVEPDDAAHGMGLLPASATLEAVIIARGAGAPSAPLLAFRFRTSRYLNLADWGAALSQDVGTLADPGLPDTLWTGADPLSIAEPTLLPFFKEALPERPLLRRINRVNRPPILVLTLPEPLPWRRFELVLWEPAAPAGGGGGGAAGGQPQHSTIQSNQFHVPHAGSNYLIPLSRYKGAAAVNGPANPMTRLKAEKSATAVAELQAVPGPPSAPRKVPIKMVWVEDGSRAFVLPTEGTERLNSDDYDLEVRYAHLLPDVAGNRVIDAMTRRIRVPVGT